MAFPTVPEYLPNEKEHRRKLAHASNSQLQGKLNALLAVTLNPSSTTTIIKDARISAQSAFIPTATNAHSAAAIASGIWVSNALPALGSTPGSATVNHASSSNTDQNLILVIIG